MNDGVGDMDAALKFLLAAKRAEIQVLEQLAVTCELVSGIAQLVHMLQRERGASSMYLASRGTRFSEQLTACRADSVASERSVRDHFDRLETDAVRGASSVRLFSGIAQVLHGFGSLPELRGRVRSLALTPDESAFAYSRQINGLMGVVFEAADAAPDPDVSRALVAMFNFMQGKELAGQERALGVAGFAEGVFELDRQQRLTHLIEGQARCFDVFSEFAAPEVWMRWHNAVSLEDSAEIERLRRLAATTRQLGPEHGEIGGWWFELMTRRIDAMRQIEALLTAGLSALCACKVEEAQAALSSHQAATAALSGLAPPDAGALAAFIDSKAAGSDPDSPAVGSATLGRSVLDLIQAQSQRIQSMADELGAVRAALNERKLIERAKGVLMAHRGLSEEQAHRLLRQTAMDQGRRLVDVAESVLALGSLLKASGK
ncbi:MAG: nitrate- and nitrite sensing domain-containing protein [Rhodocyclaceae bacterium]